MPGCTRDYHWDQKNVPSSQQNDYSSPEPGMKKLTEQEMDCLNSIRKANKAWKYLSWVILGIVAFAEVLTYFLSGTDQAIHYVCLGVFVYTVTLWKGRPASILIEKLFEDQPVSPDTRGDQACNA